MIEVHLTGQRRKFHAALLHEEAPETSARISEMLARGPVVGPSYHSIYSGQEFYVYCPPADIPLENHIVWPRPGDLVYYFFPARRYAGMHVHKGRIGNDEGAEIALWYGHGDLRVVTESGIRGNLFARIVEDELEDFYAAGDHILANGREDVEIRVAG